MESQSLKSPLIPSITPFDRCGNAWAFAQDFLLEALVLLLHFLLLASDTPKFSTSSLPFKLSLTQAGWTKMLCKKHWKNAVSLSNQRDIPAPAESPFLSLIVPYIADEQTRSSSSLSITKEDTGTLASTINLSLTDRTTRGVLPVK